MLKVIDEKRFSSTEKARRATGYMLRFVSNCRSKNRDERITERRLSVQELKQEAQKSIPRDRKFKQLENTLGLETADEGILRCTGRMMNSDLDDGAKKPILLPAYHALTDLLIDRAH